VVGDGEIRASDSDRESVVAILRDAHGEGRLTLDEFDERMNAAYSARTWASLRELTRDLPADPALGAGPGRMRPAVYQLQGAPPARRTHLGPMLPVLALVWVALAGAGHSGGLVVITAVLIFIMVVRLTARHRHDDHDRRPGAGPR
jgi:hypothetical protein